MSRSFAPLLLLCAVTAFAQTATVSPQLLVPKYAPIGRTWRVDLYTDPSLSPADSITLTYAIPAGTSLSKIDTPPTTKCTSDSGTIVCTDTISVRATIYLGVPASTPPGTLFTHVATATGPDGVVSTTTATNVAQPAPVVDITTLLQPAVIAGERFTYGITIRSHGETAAMRVQATAQILDKNVLVYQMTQAAGPPFTCTWYCTTSAFPAGADAAFVVTASMPWGFTGAQVVTPTVFLPDYGLEIDDVPHAVSVSRLADLGVSVKGLTAMAIGDENEIQVRPVDKGPSAASATVTITVPQAFRIEHVDSPNCAAPRGGTVVCDFDAQAFGDVFLTLLATAAGTANVTATVTGDAPDPNPTNDSSTLAVNIVPTKQADVEASIDAGAPNANAGDVVDYVASVTNHGPSPAIRPKVTLTLPPGATVVSIDADCSGTPIVCGDSLGYPLGSQESASWRFRLSLTRAGIATTTIAATSETPDPNGANNVASIATAVQLGLADLGIDALLYSTGVRPGDPIDFGVDVWNVGPAPAVNVKATVQSPKDTQPMLLPANCEVANDVVTCSFATIAAHSDVPWDMKFAAPNAPSFAVTFSVAADSIDPNPANNSKTQAVAITGVFPGADADLSISLPPEITIKRGEEVAVQTEATNHGAAYANATVTFLAPDGMTITTNPLSCDGATKSVSVPLTLAPGGSSQPVVNLCTSSDSPFSGKLIARITSALHDPDLANNVAVANVTIPQPPLTLDVTPVGWATLGYPADWLITVTNTSASNTDVTLDDSLPPVLTVVGARASAGACSGNLVCSLGTLTPGARVVIDVTAVPQVWGEISHTVSIRGVATPPVTSTVTVWNFFPHRPARH